MAEPHRVGQRISYNGALCTVRYVGEVTGTTGTWLGVEWDDGTRGKHDGSHKGVRYFSCRSNSPNAASLVRPTRPADEPQSFIAALREKYAPTTANDADDASTQIKFGSKVAQEMGFDKIRRKFAQVKELKSVILDGMRIHKAREPNEDPIGETCPSLTQLDLSRNLFTGLGPVMEICDELRFLKTLRLNGNRFQETIKDEEILRWRSIFQGLTELTLKNTLLSWEQLCLIASSCVSLTTLNAGLNQLSHLPPVSYLALSSSLTNLSLEYNDVRYLSDLRGLAGLKGLRNLHLKGNAIVGIAEGNAPTPVFSESIQYLDVSYNQIAEWSFVDKLPAAFPGLTGLRITHNPVYDVKSDDTKGSSSEEAHMFTIARLAVLRSLNFSEITSDDRMNAEMFYLSRIAKQLAAVPESAENTVKAQHPRYRELCEIYGEPDVIRSDEVNPSFLEARLLTVTFTCEGKGKVTKRIPKSFDIYAVKGIAGGLFGLPPLKLRLVWETGEWDPVAGFDDEGDESDEDEQDLPDTQGDSNGATSAVNTKGRWIKREVELTDSPRQLGYVVDGTVAKIRVESIL
ncbi:hypothetical protein NLU13_3145 [Sarocladium strictum]|uniref:CAP-Gly domain-containing protein n=1 Tax=Sarocladium strictum TaxID=5046 RepID=A0AA39LA54_SARSR|nr:hypothetical protein NLU13_3145 [Sarocladium strictum]